MKWRRGRTFPVLRKRRSMKIKPIQTQADCDAALRRIETLWGAGAGTPEGDELDALATLVEAYEKKKDDDEDEHHARV